MSNLIQLAKDSAKEIIEDKNMEHEPILVISDVDGKVSIIGLPITPEVKNHFQEILPEVLRKYNAISYVFIIEAWSTQSSRPLTEHMAVSDLPLDDRQEILMITYAENGKVYHTEMAEIKNTPSGRKIGNYREMSSGISGRMIVRKW